MTDLARENSITLQTTEDKQGILHQISGILDEAGVNLTSIHSFPVEDCHQFQIGLACKRNSPEVQKAITRIREKATVEVLP
jgi:prephenate dehydratase